METGFDLTHPGVFLQEAVLAPEGMSAGKLAPQLGLKETELCEFLRGESNVTSRLADQLADYFGTSSEYWTNMQTAYDAQIRARAERA